MTARMYWSHFPVPQKRIRNKLDQLQRSSHQRKQTSVNVSNTYVISCFDRQCKHSWLGQNCRQRTKQGSSRVRKCLVPCNICMLIYDRYAKPRSNWKGQHQAQLLAKYRWAVKAQERHCQALTYSICSTMAWQALYLSANISWCILALRMEPPEALSRG